MQKRGLYVVLLIALLLFGCKPKHEKLYPTYINVDSFTFVANTAVKGVTLSHHISCVWAYYNNNPIGVFDLPATFPVMADGKGTLELFPGIAINGQNDVTCIYPFYEPDTFSFTAQPGKTINLLPVTRYYSNIKPYIISNFDTGGRTNFSIDAGTVPMTVTNTLPYEGVGSGIISLRPLIDSSFDSTIRSFAIPKGEAFIEFNYKCTVPFTVFLQANVGSVASLAPSPVAGVYSSDHWQKFYLNVANYAAQAQGTSYNFYIKAYSASDATSTILLDNIQLITY